MPRRVMTASQSTLSRRNFFGAAAGISLGLAGLRRSYGLDGLMPAPVFGFGPLVDDPEALLALPEGFTYTVISRVGERMDDGFYVPARHDGMATFPGPDGLTLLVRNHEMNWRSPGRLGRSDVITSFSGASTPAPSTTSVTAVGRRWEEQLRSCSTRASSAWSGTG